MGAVMRAALDAIQYAYSGNVNEELLCLIRPGADLNGAKVCLDHGEDRGRAASATQHRVRRGAHDGAAGPRRSNSSARPVTINAVLAQES